jgi:hypothetical protein
VSGGHFDYIQHQIKDMADELQRLILSNNCNVLDSFGYPIDRHYPPAVIAEFKHTQKLLEDAAKYLNAVDYLVSDDYGVESFLERIEELQNEEGGTTGSL